MFRNKFNLSVFIDVPEKVREIAPRMCSVLFRYNINATSLVDVSEVS
jgi:hypothetical protein